MLIVGSLFAGIGGFDLGLERAGMRTAWFCENDEFCQRVLAQHWPGVPCYGDIRELDEWLVEPVDVLCGGFPCQDISAAGKGAGLAGARSGLWSEYARLVGELRPRYVIVENVPLLRTRGLDQVLEDLDACGYDAEWDGIPASAVGAPHRRDRIWLLAYPRSRRWLADTNGQRSAIGREAGHLASPTRAFEGDSEQRERRRDATDDRCATLADAHSDDGRPRRTWGSHPGGSRERESERPFQDAADPERSRLEGQRSHAGQPQVAEPRDCGWWAVEPDVGRVAYGVPNRVDRLRALGNALVPQIAEWIGHRIVEYERSIA